MMPMIGMTMFLTNEADHRRERRADDDGHRQVDHVATGDELPEVREELAHGCLPGRRRSRGKVDRRSTPDRDEAAPDALGMAAITTRHRGLGSRHGRRHHWSERAHRNGAPVLVGGRRSPGGAARATGWLGSRHRLGPRHRHDRRRWPGGPRRRRAPRRAKGWRRAAGPRSTRRPCCRAGSRAPRSSPRRSPGSGVRRRSSCPGPPSGTTASRGDEVLGEEAPPGYDFLVERLRRPGRRPRRPRRTPASARSTSAPGSCCPARAARSVRSGSRSSWGSGRRPATERSGCRGSTSTTRSARSAMPSTTTVCPARPTSSLRTRSPTPSSPRRSPARCTGRRSSRSLGSSRRCRSGSARWPTRCCSSPQRVEPTALLASGYQFLHRDLDEALASL